MRHTVRTSPPRPTPTHPAPEPQVAMERGSRDNITVIVVDITQAAEGRSTPEPLDLIVPSSAHNEDGTARDDVNDNAASSYSLGTCVFIKSKSTK